MPEWRIEVGEVNSEQTPKDPSGDSGAAVPQTCRPRRETWRTRAKQCSLATPDTGLIVDFLWKAPKAAQMEEELCRTLEHWQHRKPRALHTNYGATDNLREDTIIVCAVSIVPVVMSCAF